MKRLKTHEKGIVREKCEKKGGRNSVWDLISLETEWREGKKSKS